MINSYKDKPIPKRLERVTTRDFGAIDFDDSSKLSDEALVCAFEAGLAGESQYARTDGFNAPYYASFENSYKSIFLRKTLVDKLLKINEILAKAGLELFLLDGYRSIPLQTDIWNFFIGKAEEILDHPSEKEKEDFAVQFASDPRYFDPNDKTTWPLHSTGGAIDLTLRRLSSHETMYMGCVFDDPAPQSATHFFEDKLINDPKNFMESDRAALINRRILYHVMTENGFTNFDFEIWHYDFGTQLWALTKNIEEHGNREGGYEAIYKTLPSVR